MNRPDPDPFGARLVLVALVLVVSAVPLVYLADTFEAVTAPKLFALHAGTALACLGWILKVRRGPQRSLLDLPPALPAICGLVLACLSGARTTHPLDTVGELLNQAVLVALLVSASAVSGKKALGVVLWSCCVTGLAVAVLAVIQYRGLDILDIPSAALPSATFGNRNLMAEYLVWVLPLSAFLFLTSRGWKRRAISGGSTALIGASLVYARTRGAWVGLGVALLAVAAILVCSPEWRRRLAADLRERRPGGWWIVACGSLFVLLSTLPPGLAANAGSVAHKPGVLAAATGLLRDESVHDGGTGERLTFWKNTVRMVRDNPLLGVGPGGWARAYPPYDGGATLSPVNTPRYPHNDYLWIASEQGLLGLGVYLWFLVVGFGCLFRMTRSDDPQIRLAFPAFAASVLGLLGSACFGFPRNEPPTSLAVPVLFGLAAGAMAGGEGRGRRTVTRRALTGIGVALLALSLVASGVSWNRIAFDRHYLRALSWAQPPEQWGAVLDETRRAVDSGVFRPHVLFVQGLALEGLGRPGEAETALNASLAMTPHAWYVREGLGLACQQQGRLDEAISHFRAALALCPAAAGVHTRLGHALKSAGDLPAAMEQYRLALRIVPRDIEALNGLGVAQILSGDPEGAMASWRQVLTISPGHAEARYNLGAALQQRGDLAGAIREYREALRTRPAYGRARFGLASALAGSGDRAGAVQILRSGLAPGEDEALRRRSLDLLRALESNP